MASWKVGGSEERGDGGVSKTISGSALNDREEEGAVSGREA